MAWWLKGLNAEWLLDFFFFLFSSHNHKDLPFLQFLLIWLPLPKFYILLCYGPSPDDNHNICCYHDIVMIQSSLDWQVGGYPFCLGLEKYPSSLHGFYKIVIFSLTISGVWGTSKTSVLLVLNSLNFIKYVLYFHLFIGPMNQMLKL